MNWMGGSRRQVMKCSEVKKQKEFFAKRRRQKWLNHPGPPASPKEGNTGNIDLLTMFIVNQIALKKEHAGKPKITHLSTAEGTRKCVGQKPLELPMSPCSPSCLNLAQSDPRYSVQTGCLKSRKQSLLEELKFKVLSPVLEANHSDNSASDYKHKHHHYRGSVSSFSSASPTPSEGFLSRPTAHITSPPLWEPSCSPQDDSWTVVPHQSQLSQISPAAGDQLGSTIHSSLENNRPSKCLGDEYLPNPLKRNDQQDGQLFLGFNGEEYKGQDLFNEETIPIHLKEVASCPPTGAHDFSESFNRYHSADFIPQPLISEQGFSNADCRPCSSHSRVSNNASEMPVSYSSGVGNISSTTGNTQYTQPATSHMQPCHSEETPTIRSQHCLSGLNSARRVLYFSQKADIQSVGIPEKTSSGTQDVGTQTATVSTSTTQDASVQCCLLKAEKRLGIYTEHIAPHTSTLKNKKLTASTTRRQTGKSNESLPNVTQCTLSEIHTVRRSTPWQTSTTREATQRAPEAITVPQSPCKSKSRASTSKHPLPSSHCFYPDAPESKEKLPGNMVVRGERCEGHKEKSVNKNPAENAWSTEEHSSEGGVNWISGETGTLQEIADILLMLKQKNKHP